jgi:hypothetical protein
MTALTGESTSFPLELTSRGRSKGPRALRCDCHAHWWTSTNRHGLRGLPPFYVSSRLTPFRCSHTAVPVTFQARKEAANERMGPVRQLQGLYKPRQTMMIPQFRILTSGLSLTPPSACGDLQDT